MDNEPSPSTSSSESQKFECSEPGCFLSYTKKRNLTRHIQTHHTTKSTIDQLSCNKCLSYTTLRKDDLKRHVAKCKGSKPLDQEPLQLRSPIRSGKKFFCSIKDVNCEYSSFKKQNVERHMLTHLSKAEKFDCPAEGCGISFSCKDSLKRHLKGRCKSGGTEHRNDTQQSPPEPSNCETDSESLSDVDLQHCELSDGETLLPTMMPQVSTVQTRTQYDDVDYVPVEEAESVGGMSDLAGK